MPPTVFLIDASPYLFRAYFSAPRTIVDREGKVANAVYGFTGFVARLVTDEKPTHIAVAFDRHFNGSFRNDYYPPYKAHREASPPELDAQVDPSLEVMEAMGIATFIDERYEADDLIATIIDRTASSGAHYVIVSSDKDLTQLVSERITLINPARNLRFDPAGVVEKFGVRPDQITDLLALAGDAVDNIPGVRGIGPKTAAELLRRHGTLEAIYAAVPEMRRSAVKSAVSLAAKLEQDVANAGLSKRLATVATDAPIEVTLKGLEYRGPDAERGRSIFGKLGFETFGERLTRKII